MIETYTTIASKAEGLYKDKGSKFLSFAIPVRSVEEIKPILEQYRKDYYDARHCCYAYKILNTEESTNDEYLWRANDDGEPSGTAGRPILGQINSKGLSNILVIVIRYFGGILLGTSGLIVAYKEATRDAIEHATLVEKDVLLRKTIRFPYEKMSETMKLIRDTETRIVSQGYEDNLCTMELEIKKKNEGRI